VVTARELQQRSETFALNVISVCRALPPTAEAKMIGHQLVRSATGVASNYRATCRARSRAEFVAKLGIVVEEADESHMWLGLLLRLRLLAGTDVERLREEANELTAIFVASRRTASGMRRTGADGSRD
jgi:four helix bundle protein